MVIIFPSFIGLMAQMLHAKRQDYWPFDSGEENFERLFNIYGVVAILVKWPRCG